MQTLKQRARLLKDMESEPFHTWVILAKCGGGLSALALIAVIGASEGEGREAVSRAKAVSTHAAQPAQAHRQQVFNERRQRYDGLAHQRNMAERKTGPADLSPVTLQ